MNVNSNSYVLGFAVVVCVAVSASLAVIANSLKSTQLAAAELDRQKNVLMAAGLADRDSPAEEVERLYAERVEESIIDTKSGEVAAGMTTANWQVLSKDEKRRFRVLATIKSDDRVAAYVLPISGKGLWSTLYGYLALEGDGNTVKGITFYKHGETPGLGGEVENPEWQAKWPGKTILDDGELVSITVKKGEVNESVPAERKHFVDGLAGATITCNGVTRFVKNDLQAFKPFLSKVWNQ